MAHEKWESLEAAEKTKALHRVVRGNLQVRFNGDERLPDLDDYLDDGMSDEQRLDAFGQWRDDFDAVHARITSPDLDSSPQSRPE